jgi:crotonobetainyl-CoA:carnitine CoA-transferase CaiB-like acyl-CoA transferase
MRNAGPLAGIRVIDLSHQAAGPWCTTLLGDMGAEVWKIEKPGRGDAIRHAGGADPSVGSFNFWGLNRNKKSVGADVLVENFRPGVMRRLGLDYEVLCELNPRLVYASITAFGDRGPMAESPGMDLILQATGGMMGLTGFPGGPPVKAAGPVADIASGIYGAYAVALALFHRERTGMGQRIDLTMLDAAISLLADVTTAYLNTGEEYEKFGDGHPNLVPYQAFEANDGYFIVACLTNAFFKRLCRGLGREDLLDDPRFATNNARCRHRAEVVGVLQEIFHTRGRDHWIRLCAEHDVPSCRVNSLKDMFEMEQLAAIGSVASWEHPLIGPFRTMNVIFRMSETPGALRIPPPVLAQHTDEVLRVLGKSAEEIARLKESGVCG